MTPLVAVRATVCACRYNVNVSCVEEHFDFGVGANNAVLHLRRRKPTGTPEHRQYIKTDTTTETVTSPT